MSSSSSSLPSPPSGANPYDFYLSLLIASAQLNPTDPAGFKARLIVLFIILACLLVASAANIGVHLWTYKVKRKRVWLFRLVGRDSGKHILSNHFMLCGLSGLGLFVIVFGGVFTLYRTFFGGEPARMAQLTKWTVTIWPFAYAAGWLLSWATFQSFLHVEGGRHRSRMTIPAWAENTLYIVGGIGAVGALAALAGIGTHASHVQWSSFFTLEKYLEEGAASWDGKSSIGAEEGQMLLNLFSVYEAAVSDFYHTSSDLCIGAAVLPFFLLVINCLMASFVVTIRRQIRYQIDQLPTLIGRNGIEMDLGGAGAFSPDVRRVHKIEDGQYGRDDLEKTELGIAVPRSLPLTANVVDNFPTFVPLEPTPSPGQPRTPTADPPSFGSSSRSRSRPSSPSSFMAFSPIAGLRSAFQDIAVTPGPTRHTRAKVRTLAHDPEVIGQEQAERLIALLKAEQELLVVGVSILLIAIALAVTCAWSVPTLRNYREIGWSEFEAFVTAPMWICALGLMFAEASHAWVGWQHLKPWLQRQRREVQDARNRSQAAGSSGGSGSSGSRGVKGWVKPTASSLERKRHGSGSGQGFGLGLGNGVDTGVSVEVQVQEMVIEPQGDHPEDETLHEQDDQSMELTERIGIADGGHIRASSWEKMEMPKRKEAWEDN
ncbi:hypothetical protein JCM5296_003813 [Sporobolomyces johnsonii]